VGFCRGQLDHENHWLIDYATISDRVRPYIENALDHRYLNKVFSLHNHQGPTTAENLALFIYWTLALLLTCLHQIEVHETASTVVRYPVR
jgi:6-pyruvoyl-tetrahydropterin synthase